MKLRLLALPLAALVASLCWAGRPQAPPPPPPPGMVLVPAGDFLAGSNDPDADEDVKPQRTVYLPAFYIDRCEVTNAQYHAFNPDFSFPKGTEDHPVTHLTKDKVEAYLKSVGKRLPTSLEWEKAARGTDGRRYAWGNQWDPSRAHVGGKSDLRELVSPDGMESCSLPRLKPVGSFPSGASPYGCLDMTGNAWEWVSDERNGQPMIRGGAFGYAERYCRTYAFALEGTGMT